MIFDTHCHYNLEPLHIDWSTHWKKAQTNGVEGAIVVGTALASSMKAIKIAASDQNLFASIGIHPNEYLSKTEAGAQTDYQELLSIADESKVVAVGETGLDFFHLKKSPELSSLSDQEKDHAKAVQFFALRLQIKLAKDKKLPLILHVRDVEEEAYWQTLEALKLEHFAGISILHCVSGPLAYVQQALEMGAYIGVAGNVTYKSAENIRQIIRQTPPEKILSETDAPFLPPMPFRGQTCEPWMIAKTVSFLTEELHLDPAMLLQNAKTAFNLYNEESS